MEGSEWGQQSLFTHQGMVEAGKKKAPKIHTLMQRLGPAASHKGSVDNQSCRAAPWAAWTLQPWLG